MIRYFNRSKRQTVKSSKSQREVDKAKPKDDLQDDSDTVNRDLPKQSILRNGISASISCNDDDIIQYQRHSSDGSNISEEKRNGNQSKSRDRLSLVGWSLKKLRPSKPGKKKDDADSMSGGEPTSEINKLSSEQIVSRSQTAEVLCTNGSSGVAAEQNVENSDINVDINNSSLSETNSELLREIPGAAMSRNSLLNKAYSIEISRRRCFEHQSDDYNDVETCSVCMALVQQLDVSELNNQSESNDDIISLTSSAREGAIPESAVEQVHDYLPRDASASDVSSGSDERWSLTKELVRLSTYGWYWGPISREEAEEKIADQPDGAFLVRDSTDERYLFSLSFRSSGRTLHTRIEYWNGEFSFYIQPRGESYRSIAELIGNSMTDSMTGAFCYSRSNIPGAPSFAVTLTKPVSRFAQVRSLQYLCRFVIRQHTRVDHIQSLPLPGSVKGWLKESQY